MKIRELLSDESKWTKFTLARNAQGEPSAPCSPQTTCWCMNGAIYYCYPMSEVYDIQEKVENKIAPYASIGSWNDAPGRTFTEVKQLVEELNI